MKLLGLSHVANSIVGDQSVRGISGGEKRRVSFGVEMVAGRECLLADLPTNGLDSATAYALIRTMRFTCKAGTSMMCAIVQPSPELFRLFHRIIVLSKGAVLYSGPLSHVEKFLADSGFMRPASKGLPQFLEELTSSPELYYVHRFSRELKERGQGNQPDNKAGVDLSKQLGVGKEKNEGGTSESKVNEEEDRSSDQRPAESRSSEVEEAAFGDGGKGDRSYDEAKAVTRPSVSNNRVQCWNLLVDVYEGSRFKQEVMSQIQRNKEKQQDPSKSPQHSEEAPDGYHPPSKGAPPPSSDGKAGGESGEGGGLRIRRDHGVWNFWYRRWNSGPLRQFNENLKRMSLVFLRTVGLWRNTWLRAVFIGFILGSLFYDLHDSSTDIRNRVGLIFYVSLYLGFGGIQLFPVLSAQRPVYYAQLTAGYFQGFTYYIALQIVQIPILIIETTLLLVPIWGLSNLSGGDFISNQFWFAWITLLMTSFISRAWVLMLLSISPVEAFANVLLVMSAPLIALLYCRHLLPFE